MPSNLSNKLEGIFKYFGRAPYRGRAIRESASLPSSAFAPDRSRWSRHYYPSRASRKASNDSANFFHRRILSQYLFVQFSFTNPEGI